ncbi:MAG: prepilin peptidase [Patescibacteria group bacterium]|nr:prepilin peptidase [Patescibacteria group bacterium]
MLEQILLFLLFIFGLIVGSFLNVVIYWLESKENSLTRLVILGTNGTPESKKTGKDSGQARMTRENLGGRSFCPHCQHQLNFFDLIPVASWFFLKGKCRYCRKKISYQYPLVEIATGFIFLLTFTYKNSIFNQPSYLLLATVLLLIVNCLLLTIFVFDLKHQIIPDSIIYPAIILAVFYLIFLNANPFSLGPVLFSLGSAFLAGGFFYAIAAISDGKWMGGGDIKLAFLLGLLLGWPNILVGLFLGFFSGAIVGLLLIALKKEKLNSAIPFGPFLIVSAWATLFLGEKIIQWYLRIMGFN